MDNLKKYHVVLASNSPRRRELLAGLGIDYEVMVLPADASMRLLRAGELSAGDPVVVIPTDTGLPDGVYSGVAVTEDLRPISLLLQ